MILNTSAYIPYESISGIILVNPEYPDHPFLSGTGFFAHFPPYDHIFFVTARHCLINDNGNPIGELKIPFSQNSGGNYEAIPFTHFLETGYIDDEHKLKEDVVVCIIGSITNERKEQLMKRALCLRHQDEVDYNIKRIITNSEKIRTVGFPSVSKFIDYDDMQATLQPRGWHANIEEAGYFKNWYKIKNSSWGKVSADGTVQNSSTNDAPSFDGFSGSPILEFSTSLLSGEVIAMPIGVFVATSYFISVNVVTDMITNYINSLNSKK